MCGFSGIFTKSKISSSALVKSLSSIKHRGPDDSLIVTHHDQKNIIFSCHLSNNYSKSCFKKVDETESNNWIGFNRLSILDLSKKGMQPFFDQNTETSFMMVGEIYNYKEIRTKFFSSNEIFKTETDTEVAFKLFLKLGNEFIHELNGMFSIVIVKYKENKVSIWRDRLGIKPFYYTLCGNSFIFSSEIKGIFGTEKLNKHINYRNLAYTYYLGTSISPLTIYNDVYSLPPATYMEVDLDLYSYKSYPYWKLKYNEESEIISKEEFLEDISLIVRETYVPHIKKAIMLSGGIDSGIMANYFNEWMSEIHGISIYNTNDDSLNELEYAKLNSKKSGIKLTDFEVPDTVSLKTIIDYVLSEEEPAISPEPALFLSEKAYNDNYKILYSALGIDELFGGYSYYKLAKMSSYFKGMLMCKNLKYLFKSNTNKRKKWEEINTYGFKALPFIIRSKFSWNDIVKLFNSHDSEEWKHPVEYIFGTIKNTLPEWETMPILKQISWLDFHYYISSHHSLRSDQPAMKYSIEMRFPFLNHQFVQKYFNQKYLFEGIFKNNKPFVRDRIDSIVTEKILKAKKRGFSMPVSSWIENVDKNLFNDKIDLLLTNNSFSPEDIKYYKQNGTAYQKWMLFSTSILINDIDYK
ncbi:asparagine synthase (glutamine-hydrolyzing) [Apibacter sp. HY039]|uniref:asparagine synthase (glutamine-hydrolyzing) n=1 Tax=Apibacter sp. HY039 TaxID=2501476 RepID=UPI000FEB91BC|nr:asparagine synthase (glutamine-hydrolyzing) [Apibacter sp. HY039]